LFEESGWIDRKKRNLSLTRRLTVFSQNTTALKSRQCGSMFNAIQGPDPRRRECHNLAVEHKGQRLRRGKVGIVGGDARFARRPGSTDRKKGWTLLKKSPLDIDRKSLVDGKELDGPSLTPRRVEGKEGSLGERKIRQ